jgi:N-acetylmuramoyl-L-alanine amidase
MLLAKAMIMCLLSGILRGAAVLFLAACMARAADPPRPIKVMIDPGHGGEHVGAVGPKEMAAKKGAKPPPRLLEKNVALTLAKLVGERLRANGFMIGYTRTTDTMVPLLDRAVAANDAGADIFVSIHLNAFTNKNAKGSEVFFLSMGPVDKDLQDLADADNEPEKPSEEQDYLAAILEDMAQAAFLHESECLAVCIQEELNRLAGIKERGVKQAPFAVLRAAAMPAVLVEVAFISNPIEAAKLRDPIFLKSAAHAIARGIQRHIESTGHNGNNRTWRRPIL